MFDTETIHVHDSSPPFKNLLAAGRIRHEPEKEFTTDFAQVYQQKHGRIHSKTEKHSTVFVREVPISGHGIADLLVLSWKESFDIAKISELGKAKPIIRAFEVKMTDWRIGLMQAHRYRYYANTSILVIPKAVLPRAIPNLRLFQDAHVGLWGFNPDTKGITRIYTPRPKSINQNRKPYIRALETICKAATSR